MALESFGEETSTSLVSHHPSVVTPKKLFELYRATMGVSFPEIVVLDWSDKENKKASWLIGALGPERVWRGVRDCVSHWATFTYHCEIDCGLHKTPKKPSITFLQDHAFTIVKFAP